MSPPRDTGLHIMLQRINQTSPETVFPCVAGICPSCDFMPHRMLRFADSRAMVVLQVHSSGE